MTSTVERPAEGDDQADPAGAGSRRPRVVMLVANDISRDSRVQKVAYSAAEAGFDVLLVGYVPSGSSVPTGESRLGAARVVRTGLTNRYRARARQLRAELPAAGGVRRVALQARVGLLRGGSFASTVNYKLRRRILKSVAEPGTARPGVKGQAKELLWKIYVREGDWRRTQLHLSQIEAAWWPVLAEFQPDLIHAHDMHTPGIAVRIADRLGRQGKRPKVLYDAHEFVAGVRMGTVRERAYQGLEREYIGRADAVVTVSPELAELLQDRYGLSEPPTVVTNAPFLHTPGADGDDAPSLRATVGLADDVPLLVYSGAVAPMRGIHTMVEALPDLPGVHAAIVCGKQDRFVAELVATAERLGAGDRLHVVPYVAPHQVTHFLASATIGVIPILHTPNHEIALITKYYEYMHARLPIVVSDVKAMAAKTRQLGNGEVFTAGDPASFARAVRAVLADPGRYTACYTPDLLAENSWEGQAAVLNRLYARLVGRTPEPRSGTRPFKEVFSAEVAVR
ncbi:glycosyltransferase [Carbonactinospora thermoautotrophica]|uniref:glycosyltransferase n=1 Tax=Carbonactinospora thermoautotrophica TaxID=1469144 RepID=UPI00226F1AB9|nr:glycosyltransferase [Carbonactinospora thermoautotrophica]